MALAPPFELLDLPDGGELVTRVTAWDQDRATIKPARAPQGVEVPIVRLHVPPADKPTAPPWWDVTATTLQPTLVAALPAVVQGGRWIRIRKQGIAPRARFSLDVLAPDFTGPAFAGRR